MRLFSIISRTLVLSGFTPLQRCSRCILQLQLTGPVFFEEGKKNEIKYFLFTDVRMKERQTEKKEYKKKKKERKKDYRNDISKKKEDRMKAFSFSGERKKERKKERKITGMIFRKRRKTE